MKSINLLIRAIESFTFHDEKPIYILMKYEFFQEILMELIIVNDPIYSCIFYSLENKEFMNIPIIRTVDIKENFIIL